jgi:hypothetical protein
MQTERYLPSSNTSRIMARSRRYRPRVHYGAAVHEWSLIERTIQAACSSNFGEIERVSFPCSTELRPRALPSKISLRRAYMS